MKRKSLHHSSAPTILSVLIIILSLLPTWFAPLASAQAVPISYDQASATIIVGTTYADPNQARDPANAPKTAVTLDQLAASLNNPALLQNQAPGVWLLRAHLLIRPTARLEVLAPAVTELRLDSTPQHSPANVAITAQGGHVLITGVQVHSWDTTTNQFDTTISDGRSFLLAFEGGRLDLIDADVGYLGWAAGEQSGLAWRERADQNDPLTGATGSIVRTNVHHNYFGQYSYEAYGLLIQQSRFYSNIEYGIDPHDYSTGFIVENNTVFANGNHGIIFSRGCYNNIIRNNEVYDNALHGIMLDRGSNENTVENNVVYGNIDGMAIFQSSDNIIQNNIFRDNQRGIRINATYDKGDRFDGISTNNMVRNNTIQDNTQYGIYLYERADANIFQNNSITGNMTSGIQIKTYGNIIRQNTISANGAGIAITGGSLTPIPPGDPTPVPALGRPGNNTTITQNIIEENTGDGISLTDAQNTIVGTPTPQTNSSAGNAIRLNGGVGVEISNGSQNTVIGGNVIEANDLDGVIVRDATTTRARITRNAISANGRLGISLRDGSNANLAAPTLDSALVISGDVVGGAPVGATVEVFRDLAGEGLFYVGTTTAGNDGRWSLPLPPFDDPRQGTLTAVAIDQQGNSSSFSGIPIGGRPLTISIGSGRFGEPNVYVTGNGNTVTLPQIRDQLRFISPTLDLLRDEGQGVWRMDMSLFIGRDVTLELNRDSVTWLKLRSQATTIVPQVSDPGSINYRSFVTLRTHSGAILIDGIKISSWDPNTNDYDRDISNGRSYLLAKYAARMDIKNAQLSYLGFKDGESYGISWRDTNDSDFPEVLRTRVTGEVINSELSYNYYGVYTYQAENMVFRGNRLHHNIGYGFDPHDFSHHFLIEDNDAYNNGNHGFIISRGCNNFIVRNNRSYNNVYAIDAQDRNAHGFMIDPGSPNSAYPQVPSVQNLFENNMAWGNDGYGMRILGSNNNTIRNNQFFQNLQGITVEQGSLNTLLEGNQIRNNQGYGIHVSGGSNNTTIRANSVTANSRNGIYIRTNTNTISDNLVAYNGTVTAAGRSGSGIIVSTEQPAVPGQAAAAESFEISEAEATPASLQVLSVPTNNTIQNNTVLYSAGYGIELNGASGTTVSSNSVLGNGLHGIYMTNGASNSILLKNVTRSNLGYGIRANGNTTNGNRWSQNRVYGNGAGGIITSSDANGDIRAPDIITQHSGPGLCSVQGKAQPNAIVEIFSDSADQGRYYEGQTSADANGGYNFSVPRQCTAPNLNATSTSAGQTSGFARNIGALDGPYHVLLPTIKR